MKRPVLPKNENHKAFWLILQDGLFEKDGKKYDLAEAHRIIFAPTAEEAKNVFFFSLSEQYQYSEISFDGLIILEHGARETEIYWNDEEEVCASIRGKEVLKFESKKIIEDLSKRDENNNIDAKYAVVEQPIKRDLIK